MPENPNNAKSAPELLGQTQLNYMTDLLPLQGHPIDEKMGIKLAELQREFLKSSLAEGMKALLTLGLCPQTDFQQMLGYIRNATTELGLGSGKTLETTDRLLDCYAHFSGELKSRYTDRQRLFLEFFIGLHLVMVNIIIAIDVVQDMPRLDDRRLISSDHQTEIATLSGRYSGREGFWSNFQTLSTMAFNMGRIIADIFEKNPEYGLLLMAGAYHQLVETDIASVDPSRVFGLEGQLIVIAGRMICGMRSIPEGDDRVIITMTKLLHSAGFGSNREIFEGTLIKTFTDQLHAYPGQNRDHFLELKRLTGAITQTVQNLEIITDTELLHEQFPEDEAIAVLHFNASSGCQVVRSIAKTLNAAGKKVNISVTDVNGLILFEYAHLQGQSPDLKNCPKTVIADATYVDPHIPWTNGPENKYHLIVMSHALSQVMDAEQGFETAQDLLHAVTKAAKIGGIISMTDPGELSFIQAPIMPFNAADRSGCVPKNIFQKLSLRAVAAESRISNGTKYYKIPYRLQRLRGAAPRIMVEEFENGILEYNAFVIHEVPEDVLVKLEQQRANPGACDSIINHYFAAEQRVSGLQERVRISLDRFFTTSPCPPTSTVL